NATITGWGRCAPPTILSNGDLEKLTDTSDEWIRTRTGIRERRISHVATSDLARVAALRALAAAGLEPSDLDLIIMATCTGDSVIPSPATLLQAKLGAGNAAAFDMNAACSGFVFGLDVATQMIRAGGHRRVLLVAAERLSYYLDFTNRNTAVLFGDGAGAVILEGTEGADGVQSVAIGSDGEAAGLLCVPNVGTSSDRYQSPDRSFYGVVMDGPEVFKKAVKAMGSAAARVVDDAGLALDDVDLFIPHQANIRIIDATARRLKLKPEQVFVNIERYGNTSAATIPMALTEALEEGKVRPGANIVFAAFGAGLTWAAALVRWGERTTPLGTTDADLPPTDADVFSLLAENVRFFGSGVSS
ncbi:MAG TPA: beta-ketoacyl-ACP synthase III, partial [Acidimicrobiia bacterium]|nr:beta-ketoacyl-ACP synthase III [Acidimicrobiia bacterium]